jgi:hypothetical protein
METSNNQCDLEILTIENHQNFGIYQIVAISLRSSVYFAPIYFEAK